MDFSTPINLHYTIAHKVHNYSTPLLYKEFTDEISMNITFSQSADWLVNATYQYTELLLPSYIINERIDYISYKFYNDTKYTYESNISFNALNFLGINSFISSKTDISIGEKQAFRTDSLLFLNIKNAINDSLQYTKDQVILLSGKSYTTRVFEGDIKEITLIS